MTWLPGDMPVASAAGVMRNEQQLMGKKTVDVGSVQSTTSQNGNCLFPVSRKQVSFELTMLEA